jgi:hypothetical protein
MLLLRLPLCENRLVKPQAAGACMLRPVPGAIEEALKPAAQTQIHSRLQIC